MENMNKYKNITQKLIKEEIAVIFCPDIIYLLPETYRTSMKLLAKHVKKLLGF